MLKKDKKSKNVFKIILPVLLIFLVISLILNFIFLGKLTSPIVFSNANSTRDTYFTIHNIEKAHEISTGAGVKVGIMDWGFGFDSNSELYIEGLNFSRNKSALSNADHGLWLANALREVAPDCEIYALCTTDNNEDKMVDNMVRAIDWAIENNIDILTYSNSAISGKNRPKIDEAVNKAIQNGIVTTFIHYDNPNNFLPNGFFEYGEDSETADINIFHYDYNVLFPISRPPYLSMSSTSPVLAGFVAILKSVNPNLSPADYKDILVLTSYSKEYYDKGFDQTSNIPHIADIGEAVLYMLDNY